MQHVIRIQTREKASFNKISDVGVWFNIWAVLHHLNHHFITGFDLDAGNLDNKNGRSRNLRKFQNFQQVFWGLGFWGFSVGLGFSLCF